MEILNKDHSLFGVIGFEENTLKEVIENLEHEEDEINLRINSPGGDADEGFGIYDFLINHKAKVTVEIIGEASSAAAIVAMAGDVRKMTKNATFMVHNPFIPFTGGEADDLEKNVDALRDLEKKMVNLFSERSGQPQKEIKKLMENGGTRLNSKRALELGFVTEVIGAKSMAPIVWNIADLPEEIAKQLPATREGRAKEPKEFRWQEAHSNNNILPSFFDLRINKQIYPITKENFIMLEQFVSMSGKDKAEDALAYFTKLKENKTATNADYSALESTVDTLRKDLEVKSSLLQGVVKNQCKQEIEGRRTRIDACLQEFRIDAIQHEKASEAYVGIDVEKVKETQPLFDATIEFMESSQPREDLKELTELSGSGGEGDNLSEEDLIDQLREVTGKYDIADFDKDRLISHISHDIERLKEIGFDGELIIEREIQESLERNHDIHKTVENLRRWIKG